MTAGAGFWSVPVSQANRPAEYQKRGGGVRGDAQFERADILQQNIDTYIVDRGAFQKIKSLAVLGKKSESGGDMGVTVVVAEYENQTITYTITFDVNMEIIGCL